MGSAAGAHIISCATVAEELKQLGVPEERLTVLEFGLHVYPEDLKKRLQEAMTASRVTAPSCSAMACARTRSWASSPSRTAW